MATLTTCFKEALSTIEPDEDKKNAATAHAEVLVMSLARRKSSMTWE